MDLAPHAQPPESSAAADDSTPLHDVTFVVVDLETTGGSPAGDRVTEIGAAKVRGGELLGELTTLVDPGVPIPTGITALTGITDATVAGWPPIAAVLPTFLEFAHGSVLVAHNARFDTAFLNAALERLDYPRLPHPVVCTAALARRLLRDEVRDCRLATLAGHLRCPHRPSHRALPDALATVDVLHALLERAGRFGADTLETLIEFTRARNLPLYRARRALMDGLPNAPGVYAFRSAGGEVLYVGTAGDLRARVRNYFGGDRRRRIDDLLRESAALDHWVAPTPLEAAARELRLIATHRPRYNRRSKTPRRPVWVKLTPERFPRLSIVRALRDDGGAYLGPLASRRTAEHIVEAVEDAVPLRRCKVRIGAATRLPPCALADMGRCVAPCDGRLDPPAYARTAATARAALDGDPTAVIERLDERLRTLSASGRYEEAAAARDRLRALVGAVTASRRLAALTGVQLLTASRPGRATGTREVVAVVHGRVVASATCRAGRAGDVAHRLRGAAAGGAAAAPGPHATEEAALVARWLDGRGTTVHFCAGTLAHPVAGGRRLAEEADRLAAAARTTGRPSAELAAKRTRRHQKALE